MAGEAARKRWSYADFARLPRDDGKRYEVIDGELYVTPSPSTRHQLVLSALQFALDSFVRKHELGWVIGGPLGVLLGDQDYLEPDLLFVRNERRGVLSERGAEAAPDIVVEVLSPSTEHRDRGPKAERYTLFGVPEYWIVDSREPRIEAFHMGELRMSAGPGELFRWRARPGGPDFKLRVDALVERLP